MLDIGGAGASKGKISQAISWGIACARCPATRMIRGLRLEQINAYLLGFQDDLQNTMRLLKLLDISFLE